MDLYSGNTYSEKDTVLIKTYLDRSVAFDKNSVYYHDSTLYYITKALNLSRQLEYDHHLIPIYRKYASYMNETGNYSKAMDYHYKTKELLESLPAARKELDKTRMEYIKLYVSLGITYFNMNDVDKAFSLFDKALQVIDSMNPDDESIDICNAATIIYINMSSLYIEKRDFIAARQTFEKALASLYCIKGDEKNREIRKANIYTNMGVVSRELKEYDKAEEYYDKALEIYKLYNERQYLPNVYNNLALGYQELGKWDDAIKLLDKAVDISRQYFNLRSEQIATNALSEAYFLKKDYYTAFLMKTKELILNENLLIKENHRQIAQIENKYQYEKMIKQEKLEQEISIAKREKKVLVYIIIIAVLLFICLLLIFFYRNIKTKANQQQLQSKNLELEKQNLELENQNLELEKQNLELKNLELGEDIDSKNKELTTHVMYLNQKNTFMTSIIEDLTALSKNGKEVSSAKLAAIIRQMRKNVDQNSWEEFEVRFQQVHHDFYKNLNDLVPNLTLNEKRLCAFLRLNMTTKEIASLTFQSIKSIQIARIRLRKKLHIEKDENLISILQKL